MKVYVVFNINGNIIGVANNQEDAIQIYLERHAFQDDYAYNLATSDQIEYLTEQGRIDTFLLNHFYYA